MKFAVEMSSLEVHLIPEHQRLNQVSGVKNNGQHYQLPGWVLAEFQIASGELLLWHPETSAQSGHVDIYYSPSRRDHKPGIEFRVYQHFGEFDPSDEENFAVHWPSGFWHLVSVVIAIEKKMAETSGYKPRLERWMATQFQPANYSRRQQLAV